LNILLDTCVIFYITEFRDIKPDKVALIGEAALAGKLWVSPISAWEVGMLVSKGRVPVTKHAFDYFDTFLRESTAKLCKLDVDVLINSSYLPTGVHADPMDRLLIATARSQDFTLLTSDKKILNYGRQGHVKTLAC